MLFSFEFMRRVFKLVESVGELQYKIIKEDLTVEEKEDLLYFDEMHKMTYGEDKGIINIDKIK